MGLSEGEAAGVFLVEVAGQLATDRTRRVLPVDPAEEDREVSDVHRVLLPKVCYELGLGDLRSGEMLPSPVVFAVHDRQQLVAELIAGHRLHSALHWIGVADSIDAAMRWHL